MNQVFNIRRFGNYCLKQVGEWMRGLFLHFISLAGVFTVLMLVFRFEEGDQPYITSSGAQFLIGLSFFVYIAKMSSNLSSQIAPRSRLVLYLTVPVSTLEKYLAHLLSVLLLYPFIFFAGILVAQYTSEFIASLVWQHSFNPGMPLEGFFSMWSQELDLYGINALGAWTLSIVALFTLGATIWKRSAFLKTIAAMVLINIVTVFIWIVSIGKGGASIGVVVLSIIDSKQDVMRVLVLLTYVTIAVFTLVGYMRMKELEVNETRK